jgi:hemolysin III
MLSREIEARAAGAVSLVFPTGVARRVNRAVLTATLAFGVAALALLAALALVGRDAAFAAASLVYGTSLVLCALCSFLYNMLETAKRRDLLRRLDHAAIFLLIAGTYTPFAAGIHGLFGISLLAWVWALALAGILLKLRAGRAFDRGFIALYLALGWLVLTAGREIASLPALPLAFLAAGGLAYTVGAVIYARDIGRWTDPVWHGFVLAGNVTHFLAVVALGLFPVLSSPAAL